MSSSIEQKGMIIMFVSRISSIKEYSESADSDGRWLEFILCRTPDSLMSLHCSSSGMSMRGLASDFGGSVFGLRWRIRGIVGRGARE